MVALLTEHGMTLSPETYPPRRIARDSQLSWRQKAVLHTHRRRVRRQMLRWVRRILTLGLAEVGVPDALLGFCYKKVNTFGRGISRLLPEPQGGLILNWLSGFSRVSMP